MNDEPRRHLENVNARVFSGEVAPTNDAILQDRDKAFQSLRATYVILFRPDSINFC